MSELKQLLRHLFVYLMLFWFLLSAAGCSGSMAPTPAQSDVQVYGALRQIFHQGQTGEAVNLAELLPNKHLVGVGALTDLAGEITIVRGNAYLSYPDGQQARTERVSSSREGAALLVVGEVQEWRTLITTEGTAFEDLDRMIRRLAEANGLTADRFPFLIEGVVEDLDWHVVDGTRLSGHTQSRQDHLEASVRFSWAKLQATLVGFYSEHDQGVFTHAGSATHVHCVIAEPLSSGHVDHVVVPAGTTVMLPVYP